MSKLKVKKEEKAEYKSRSVEETTSLTNAWKLQNNKWICMIFIKFLILCILINPTYFTLKKSKVVIAFKLSFPFSFSFFISDFMNPHYSEYFQFHSIFPVKKEHLFWYSILSFQARVVPSGLCFRVIYVITVCVRAA